MITKEDNEISITKNYSLVLSIQWARQHALQQHKQSIHASSISPERKINDIANLGICKKSVFFESNSISVVNLMVTPFPCTDQCICTVSFVKGPLYPSNTINTHSLLYLAEMYSPPLFIICSYVSLWFKGR